jgi:hypothetical protein
LAHMTSTGHALSDSRSDQTITVNAAWAALPFPDLFAANLSQAKAIASAYQTLLGGIPGISGFDFLIKGNLTSNFGASPSAVFNDENVFINVANALVQGNAEATTKFSTLAAGTTLSEKITSLYKSIIPDAKQSADGIAFLTRPDGLKFYQDVAKERGITAENGPAVIALASLLKVAVDGKIGIGNPVSDLIASIADGSSGLPAGSATVLPIETIDGTKFDADDASDVLPGFSGLAPAPAYSIAVSPAAVNEGDSGTGNALTYTVTRTGDISQAGTVAVALSGTATSVTDYTTSLTGGAVSFAAGASTASFTVTSTPDTVVELNESVIATLGAITGPGTLGTSTATGTINNDDRNIDLANLGSAGFRIDGAAGDFSGLVVASAGDVNRDGFPDLIIGAPTLSFYLDPTQARSSSYVVFGKASGFSNLDLANLGSAGFRIDGAAFSNNLAFSVASAGDVNGDGFADLIIGAAGADPSGRSGAGSSYVVFGKASGFSNLDLANLGSAGFRIDGVAVEDFSGSDVASAGDVNGDGFADLIIGAYAADPSGRTLAGSSYVVFGKASGFSNLDLANLGSAGFRIDGAAGFDFSGYSFASAGDVNGDGFADLIIGAWAADPSGRDGAGSSYVVFGKASGFSNLDLANLGSAGFRIDGAASDDFSGYSVASAGDVNGDGFADLIIGARAADPSGRPFAGSSYVVFGQASGFSNFDLANLGSAGFRIDGAAARDFSGSSVASAGDVNRDGFADLIIGAPAADPSGRSDAGSSYVIFGGDYW